MPMIECVVGCGSATKSLPYCGSHIILSPGGLSRHQENTVRPARVLFWGRNHLRQCWGSSLTFIVGHNSRDSRAARALSPKCAANCASHCETLRLWETLCSALFAKRCHGKARNLALSTTLLSPPHDHLFCKEI